MTFKQDSDLNVIVRKFYINFLQDSEVKRIAIIARNQIKYEKEAETKRINLSYCADFNLMDAFRYYFEYQSCLL